MALRPGGKVKRRPGPIGKPLPTQKGIGKLKLQKPKGRPKPGSKPKGPAGGPRPGSKPKPSVPRMPVTQKAMGGQASESVARSKILKDMRDRKRKRLTDSINRLTRPKGVGKPKIVPKKKPKKSK